MHDGECVSSIAPQFGQWECLQIHTISSSSPKVYKFQSKFQSDSRSNPINRYCYLI